MFRRLLFSYMRTSKLSFVSFSSTELNSTMKKLIDSKEYKKALDIFYKQSQFQTDASINMALKASTKLNDYKRGMNIVKQFSKDSLKNSFIQTSLIDFYSKSFTHSFVQ